MNKLREQKIKQEKLLKFIKIFELYQVFMHTFLVLKRVDSACE